jgi:hypothetical protein
VKGLLVAEEENFLFSYNITDLSAPLRRALTKRHSNTRSKRFTLGLCFENRGWQPQRDSNPCRHLERVVS